MFLWECYVDRHLYMPTQDGMRKHMFKRKICDKCTYCLMFEEVYIIILYTMIYVL